jgi:hypothetical protein
MKIIEGNNYREWQQKNSHVFFQLPKKQQKKARELGYRNVGWLNVQRSWAILGKIQKNTISIFEYKLRQDDLIGAVDLAIQEVENLKQTSQKSHDELIKVYDDLHDLAQQTLQKYKPL